MLDWSEASLTSTSAIRVTGLSVFDVQSTLSPFGQIVLLVLIQAGGLGYMLVSTLMLLLFVREPQLQAAGGIFSITDFPHRQFFNFGFRCDATHNTAHRCIWMFIGASPGGTGGVKTTTFAATLLTIRSTLRGESDVEAFDRRIATEAVNRAIVSSRLLFSLPGLLHSPSQNRLRFVKRVSPIISLCAFFQFEALSAFGTVGLSTGITPYITDSGRAILMLLMFLGRLGPITAATALSAPAPSLHRRLPEEEIALG